MVRDLHVAFKTPHVYYFIIKLCRQRAEVIQNHHNINVCHIGQAEATYVKSERQRPSLQSDRVTELLLKRRRS